MQQENATHLGTATYVLGSGKTSTQIAGLLLQVMRMCNVFCLQYLTFLFVESALLFFFFLLEILLQAKLEAEVSKH